MKFEPPATISSGTNRPSSDQSGRSLQQQLQTSAVSFREVNTTTGFAGSGFRMRSVLVRGAATGADLGGVFRSVAGDVQRTASYSLGKIRIALFVGQKYMLRTNDRVGVIMLSAANGSGQRIDLSSAGGATGITGISWGPEKVLRPTCSTPSDSSYSHDPQRSRKSPRPELP